MLCDKKLLCVLIYITFCVLFTITDAQDQCTTVKGNTGSCIELELCPPLHELVKKKTREDLLYINQAMCGFTQMYIPKVCCPPKSEWSTFTITPKSVNPTTISAVEIPEMMRVNYSGFICPATVKPPERNSRCCGIESVSTDKITGGDLAAIDQFPWLALLDYASPDLRCGGSLISSRYVLTAAHCLLRRDPPQRVRLAEYNTSTYPDDMVETPGGGYETITVFIFDIEKQIVHPQYSKASSSEMHDIGLIKLSRNAPFSDFIRPICLPNADVTKHPTDLRFTVAGWGYNGFKDVDVKMYVEVPYVPLHECLNSKNVTDNQICAGGEMGKDSCAGDSGGPLMYEYENGSRYVVAGIVSYGETDCGKKGKPAVYTNVYKYIDWILSEMM